MNSVFLDNLELLAQVDHIQFSASEAFNGGDKLATALCDYLLLFPSFTERIRVENPHFYKAISVSPTLIPASAPPVIGTTVVVASSGSLQNPLGRENITVNCPLESIQSSLQTVRVAEPVHLDHYKLIMKFAGKVGALLLQTA